MSREADRLIAELYHAAGLRKPRNKETKPRKPYKKRADYEQRQTTRNAKKQEKLAARQQAAEDEAARIQALRLQFLCEKNSNHGDPSSETLGPESGPQVDSTQVYTGQ